MIRMEERSLCLTLILWTFILIYRYVLYDPTASEDLFLAVAVELWLTCISSSPNRGTKPLLRWHLLVLLLTHVLLRVLTRQATTGSSYTSKSHGQDQHAWAKPTIIPSRTNHRRFFPQEHSFSYSYLLVGVPIGWRGHAGRWISVDSTKRTLLSVVGSDYLERDKSGFDLRPNLDSYLRSQHLDPGRFPYAYLVTAPRILGYSFNPASFWYLYSADRALAAMIVEVNNTFDERRLYYLERNPSSIHFTQTWNKDFHVSPFNDREGSYSLVAHDPLQAIADETMPMEISNTITLKDGRGETKLVARIFSTESPLDAAALGVLTGLRLLGRYSWVGFVTFPRILREAWKLYSHRALEVFYRPEVVRGSIGRSPTLAEKQLELFFRQFVEDCASGSTLQLQYIPAQGLGLDVEYRFGSSEVDAVGDRHVRLEVFSPAFYSRVACAPDTIEAMMQECVREDENSRTAYTSDISLLEYVFKSAFTRDESRDQQSTSLSVVDKLRWSIISSLRPTKSKAKLPSDQAWTSEKDHEAEKDQRAGKDQRGPNAFPRAAVWQHVGARMSMLDRHVVRVSSQSWLYRRLLTEQLLADRFIFGITPLVAFADLLIRGTAIWTSMLGLLRTDIVKASSLDTALRTGASIGLLGSVHIWSLLKGLKWNKASVPDRIE